MKCIPALSAIAALGIVSCDTMSTPISGGDFDPLRAPGSNTTRNTSEAPGFKSGQFVRASMNNTAFFKNRPKGDGDADKLLPQGTSMKVVSTSGSYVKVELDSGEVGFVPSVMLEDPNAATVGATPMPGEFQIYPPIQTGIGEPLPVIDPAGLPPEGAIPTVIDPDAPAPTTPVPGLTPTTETFPAPAVEPKVESVPLPPNTEDLEAMEKEKKAGE